MLVTKPKIQIAENGGAALYALFGILAVMVFTLVSNQPTLESLNPVLKLAIIATITVITLVAVGCSLHMRSLGNVSGKDLKAEAQERNAQLAELSRKVATRISHIESVMVERPEIVSKRSIDALGFAKKISLALSKRVNEINELLKGHGGMNLLEASELVYAKLAIADNFLESIIFSEPIPALELDELAPIMDQLFEVIDAELEAAHVRSSYVNASGNSKNSANA